MDKQTKNELRQAVRTTLDGITERALNYHIASKMKTHPTASREDALLLVAADAEINISQYANDAATLDRVRQLRQSRPATDAIPTPRRERLPTPKGVTLKIGRDLKLKDPILPQRIIREAKMMAERVYPKMYVLENSVREVILRVMRKAHGDGWWNTHAPDKMREGVQRRQSAEKGKAWHGKRGAHEIYYTDIDDLKRIVNKNYDDFRELFPDPTWFDHTIDVVTPSRNVSSHHNPLSADDVKRVDVFLKMWQDQYRRK